MKEFPNDTFAKLWNIIEFHAANDIKTPLGIYSLLINVDPENSHEQNFDNNYGQEQGM